MIQGGLTGGYCYRWGPGGGGGGGWSRGDCLGDCLGGDCLGGKCPDTKTDCSTLRCSCKKNGLKCNHFCGTCQLNECSSMDNKVRGNTILMTFMNININMGMCSRQVLHTQNGHITLYIGGGSMLNRYMAANKSNMPKCPTAFRVKMYHFPLADLRGFLICVC